MIPLDFTDTAKIAIFGLGRAGIGALRAVLTSKAEIYAWDDSAAGRDAVLKEDAEFRVQLMPIEEMPWAEMTLLILSPGVPLTYPKPHLVVELAHAANCPIICDIELLWRAESKKGANFTAVTGTNGKSTTTALIGHIYKSIGMPVAVGGNIGVSALELPSLGRHGRYVIETSSYQLDLLEETRFNVSILLNITPDHLDRHGNMAGYIKAKERIFHHQGARDDILDDIMIIGVDEPNSEAIYQKYKAESSATVLAISQDKPCEGVYVEGDALYDTIQPDAPGIYTLGDLPNLPGKHNRQNIAAAYAATVAAGMPPEKVIAAIHSFPGLAHRMQVVAEVDGVRFVNDSKATNAEATEKALACYNTIYWIAGGKAKDGGIEALEPYFPRIAHAFLIGDAAEQFAKTLGDKVPYTHAGTLDVAVKAAYEKAKAEGRTSPVVLLSPACASFDQFKDFEHRGDVFVSAALSLKHA